MGQMTRGGDSGGSGLVRKASPRRRPALEVEGTASARTLGQVDVGWRGQRNGRDSGCNHVEKGGEVRREAGTSWAGPVGTEGSLDFILSVQGGGSWGGMGGRGLRGTLQ